MYAPALVRQFIFCSVVFLLLLWWPFRIECTVCLVHSGWICVHTKKPIRRIRNAFGRLTHSPKSKIVRRLCIQLVLLVCFFFVFYCFLFVVVTCSVCAICTMQNDSLWAWFFAHCMPVIGRQLCVITFDTRCARLVWEVRSLVWFIVYALRRFLCTLVLYTQCTYTLVIVNRHKQPVEQQGLF